MLALTLHQSRRITSLPVLAKPAKEKVLLDSAVCKAVLFSD